jgi:hypothetical protein
MASYRVEIAKSAAKDLRAIGRKWILRIVATIETLESDPRPPGCKKLVGSDHTNRLRIGAAGKWARRAAAALPGGSVTAGTSTVRSNKSWLLTGHKLPEQEKMIC